MGAHTLESRVMGKVVQPKKTETASLLSPTKHGYPAYCDICDDEKLQWYCAANEAYLCNSCDASSVHGANSLSLRHERATFDCNESVQKVPDDASRALDEMHRSQIKHIGSSKDSDSCCCNVESLQKLKDRSTAQYHGATASQNSFVKVGGITYTSATKVKLELDGHEFHDQHGSCELSFGYNSWRESENYSSIHEVPVLVPIAQAMPSTTLAEPSKHACSSSLSTPSEDASACDFMGFLVPEYYDVDEYLVSDIDLIRKEEQELVSAVVGVEVVAGDEKAEGKMCCECKNDESRLEVSLMNESHERSIFYDYERQCDQSTDEISLKYWDMNVLKQSGKPKANCTETSFVPLAWVCEKLKVERAGDTDQINQLLETLIERPIHSISKLTCNQKSFLSLDYEDVLNAWSDRGCFWTGGQWPQTLDEASFDVGVVPDLDSSVTSVVQKEEGPVFATTETDGGREARVLRYREKRRTRLFSKKIRYEVRKRNAERRPRIKGRFVKWSVEVLRA